MADTDKSEEKDASSTPSNAEVTDVKDESWEIGKQELTILLISASFLFIVAIDSTVLVPALSVSPSMVFFFFFINQTYRP